MNARLMSYEYAPIGFEMVIQDEQVRAWNLWWNLRLTDDPEAWDDDVMRLNELQRSLGELAASQRLIRAHMAQFCRHHPTFPKNVDILCKEIGDDKLSTPVSLGCEGRGLLNALGYGDPQTPQEKRDEIFEEHGEALRKWLEHQPPETPADDKVFGILGRATDFKVAFAKELHIAITDDDPSMLSVKKLAEKAGEETDGESRLAGRYPYPFCCAFRCNAFDWSAPVPPCGCCYSLVIDAGLLCVGTFGEERSLVGEHTRFVEEYILAYADAINAWLGGSRSSVIRWSDEARYVSQGRVSEVAERVHALLGDKARGKVWLAGCLLKTISRNQRGDFKTAEVTTELIDRFPEATSWLNVDFAGEAIYQ